MKAEILQTALRGPLGPKGSLFLAQRRIRRCLEAGRTAVLELKVAQEESKPASLPFSHGPACVFSDPRLTARRHSESSLLAYILCPKSALKHPGTNSPKRERIKIKIKNNEFSGKFINVLFAWLGFSLLCFKFDSLSL